MIPFFCFFYHFFISIQFFLIFKYHPIYSSQLRIFLIPSPIGSCQFRQPKNSNLTSRIQMRTCTKITIKRFLRITQIIKRKNSFSSIFQIFNQFFFVWIISKNFHRFIIIHLFSRNRKILVYNPTHLFFNRFKISIGDFVFSKIKVLIKTFISPRTNSQMYIWMNHFDRSSHDMRCSMTTTSFNIFHGKIV